MSLGALKGASSEEMDYLGLLWQNLVLPMTTARSFLLLFLALASQSVQSAHAGTYAKFLCSMMTDSVIFSRLLERPLLNSALESIDDLFFVAQKGGFAGRPILDQPYPARLRQDLQTHVLSTARIMTFMAPLEVDFRIYNRLMRKFNSDQLDDLILFHPDILEQALRISRESHLIRYQKFRAQILAGRLVTNRDVFQNVLASAFFRNPVAVLATIKNSYANTYLPEKKAGDIGFHHKKEEVAHFLRQAFDVYLLSVEERLSQVQVGVFLPTDDPLPRDSYALTFGLPIQWLPLFHEEQNLYGVMTSPGVATVMYVEQSIEAMQRMGHSMGEAKETDATKVFKNYLAVQRILDKAQESAEGDRGKSLALAVFLHTHERWMSLGGDVDPMVTLPGLRKMWQGIGRQRDKITGVTDPRSSFGRLLYLINSDSREVGGNRELEPFTEEELGKMLGRLAALSL